MPISFFLVALGLILWFTIAPTIGLILTLVGLFFLLFETAGTWRRW